MTVPLLIIVSIIYLGAVISAAKEGRLPMAGLLVSYALANGCLIWESVRG
jgi:hypothetical protein